MLATASLLILLCGLFLSEFSHQVDAENGEVSVRDFAGLRFKRLVSVQPPGGYKQQLWKNSNRIIPQKPNGKTQKGLRPINKSKTSLRKSRKSKYKSLRKSRKSKYKSLKKSAKSRRKSRKRSRKLSRKKRGKKGKRSKKRRRGKKSSKRSKGKRGKKRSSKKRRGRKGKSRKGRRGKSKRSKSKRTG